MVVCRRFGSTLLPAQAWEGQISKEARSRMSEEDERPVAGWLGATLGDERRLCVTGVQMNVEPQEKMRRLLRV